MDILKAMQTYVSVVEAGSLAGAADRLDTSNAAISRQLAALEDHLAVRLINRTTRRLSITDAGQEFLGRAQQVLADVAEAEAIAGANAIKPSGVLRISAPLSFGISKLGKWLPSFLDLYPDIKLDIDLSDRLSDLATDGIDVAIRIARQPAFTNVVSRRIAAIDMEICASADYLSKVGSPATPAELSGLQTLNFSYLTSGDTWHLTHTDGRSTSVHLKPHVHATNGDILRDFAVNGHGITILPRFIVERDLAEGRLTRVLTEWTMTGFNLYAVYLSRKFLPVKVRLLIEHLAKASAEKLD